VEFGHGNKFEPTELFPKGTNRLFFGDNLHIMRQLPSKSIDLIYIDPPFFSGRNYNVIFGDKNEVRSFTDIWEGGMPGYLIWLNARLYEMKRLLKNTGSIFVHLDWHASHYVKVEMDKIFGISALRNEITWYYYNKMHDRRKGQLPNACDVIFWYSKTDKYKHNELKEVREKPVQQLVRKKLNGKMVNARDEDGNILYRESTEKTVDNVWRIPCLQPADKIERVGYPTQKPLELTQRIIELASDPGDVIADFFCGGGTTVISAIGIRVIRSETKTGTKKGIFADHKLERRWVGTDQSRIAIAVTADRIARAVEEKVGKLFPVPDFTIEHWGIYESPKLERLSRNEFREFVVRAFGGKPESVSPNIHGTRYGVPLYVGESSRNSRITKDDVAKFAQAIFKERRTNFGAMLAWNFSQDARKAGEILAARENKRIDFVRLNLVRLEDEPFRDHIVTKHRDYGELLSFIQPPEVRIAYERIGNLKYRFDVSESVSLNKNGIIANVQWDFDYRYRFSSTEGFAFLRDKNTGKPLLVVEYEFPGGGKKKIACSVQDDQGGERTEILEIEVN
jgi:DNA modification methylase